MPTELQLTVEQNQLKALAVRLSAEEGGKKLRLELARNLRTAVAPAVEEIKAGAQEIHKSKAMANLREINKKGEEVISALGGAIAQGVSAQVRMTGKATGVSVKARKKGMPRQFINAPKRINAQKFRHRVFGRNVWVTQIGAPGFFDRPLQGGRARYRVACVAAMNEMAQRIAR